MLVALLVPLISLAAPPGRSDRQEINIPGVRLQTYETPYYYFHTDLNVDDAREAVIRTTRMFDAYRSRTARLFNGHINQKLSFYLFAKPQEYYMAGGIEGTNGVFDGQKLMGMVIRTRQGDISRLTWHVVQHEGFHQFVSYVIQGQIPIWVNEGMAEYFGEGIFTGDDLLVGVIDDNRLKVVKDGIRENRYKSLREMMYLSHEAWNRDLQGENYDQAWSMVHFLATADKGKYQDAFAAFLQLVSHGQPWENAWIRSFGSASGFEDRWKEYWLGLPDHPTANLYARAATEGLTSYLGRAYSQHQTFTSFDEFIRTPAESLKAAPADWLPPHLFVDMKDLAGRLSGFGYKFSLDSSQPKQPPRIVCELPDGTKMYGTFEVSAGRIARVNVK